MSPARAYDAEPDRRVTLLLLDGARPDVFRALVEAGDLPNISRHVLEPGSQERATTVFPSTTGVAYLPLLTGRYPGTCDVPGIRWLDPSRYAGRWWRDREHVRSYCGYQGGRLDGDVPSDIPSLFELEPDAAGICTPFTRGLRDGARLGLKRTALGAVAHYTGGYGRLDRAVAEELRRVGRARPRLTFAVFPGVDGVTHFHTPDHPRVHRLYRQFDRAVGAYADAGGLEGDHLMAIVSDHGADRMDRHQDLSLALEETGLRVLRHPVLWRRDPDVAVMVSGNASAQVYLRPGVPRDRRWSLPEVEAGAVDGVPADLVDRILELEGVALVAGVDPASADAGATADGGDVDAEAVIVASRAGRARLVPAGDGRIRYEPLSADVLALNARSELLGQVAEPGGADAMGGAGAVDGWTGGDDGGSAARTLHEREWLAASHGGRYPDAPMQLLQLFRSGRAGDLVVAAEPHVDLREAWEHPEHRSGHGSLTGAHMRCLVALDRRVAGPLRTTDLFPLILDHLGHALPDGLDGRLPRPDPVALRESA